MVRHRKPKVDKKVQIAKHRIQHKKRAAPRPAERPEAVIPAIPKKKPKARRFRKKWDDRDNYQPGQAVGYAEEKEEKKIHFCCFDCKCSEERRAKYCNGVPFQASQDSFWHRTCCHKIRTVKSNSVAEIDWAMQELSKRMSRETDETVAVVPKTRLLNLSEIEPIYCNYKTRQEAQTQNDNMGTPSPVGVLQTNNEYIRMQRLFEERRDTKAQERLRGAVVVDAFAGMGTGIVALKRLGIGIQAVVHVEKDRVASHVYRSNHDHFYDPSLEDDDIEHICYKDFAAFLKKGLLEIVDHFGRIDIVIAGPPCSDFSAVNGNREGLDGKHGKFMKYTAKLIKTLRDVQTTDFFYVIENVPLQNDISVPLEMGDRQQVCDLLNHPWDPVELDAQYFSPCKRKRVFYSNIPLAHHDLGDSLASALTGSDCLEDGFVLPCHVVEPELRAKANTFMASLGRLDDKLSNAMVVVKKDQLRPGKFIQRTFTCDERADMMGFPKGYLQPVFELFEHISFAMQQHDQRVGDYWRGNRTRNGQDTGVPVLDPKYHPFSGGCNGESNGFRFDLDEETLELKLKMAPPKPCNKKNKKTKERPSQYYTAEQYAKRLLGNAFSVPVMEHLLKPLQPFFKTRTYPGYPYQFAWAGKLQELEREERLKAEQDRMDSGRA